ncbi:DegV family protein [Auritidibacter ignavus]|uniref:DegV family protein n=1 Tax=Auritidibacter ignavus TaxID=678932 RepID=UPI002FE6B74A
MATYTRWLTDLHTRARKIRAEVPGLGRYIKPPRKDRTVIVTDTSSALPEAVATTLPTGSQLRQIAMPVMIGEQIHSDGSADTNDELPIALAAGTPVRTSRPAPGQFRQLYERIAEQGYGSIVSVHVSGKISGTVEAARLAATQSPIPVEIVDTLTSGMAMGYAVVDAVVRGHNGIPATKLAQLIDEQATASQVYFTVPNLDQLRKGGRIPPLTGLLGQLLQVRPVLTLNEGAIQLMDRPRNFAKAQQIMVDKVAQAATQRPIRLAVHGYGNLDSAMELAARIDEYSTSPVPVLMIPAVLVAHLGLGALGVSISPELDYSTIL